MNESLITGLILTAFGVYLAGMGYCIKKIWVLDVRLGEMEIKILNIEKDILRGREEYVRRGDIINRIDRTVVKIATKLNLNDRTGEFDVQR